MSYRKLELLRRYIRTKQPKKEYDRDFQFDGMNIEEGNDELDDNNMRMDNDVAITCI